MSLADAETARFFRSSLCDEKKVTRREHFLPETDAVVQAQLLVLIEPRYPEDWTEGRATADADRDLLRGSTFSRTSML